MVMDSLTGMMQVAGLDFGISPFVDRAPLRCIGSDRQRIMSGTPDDTVRITRLNELV